MASRLPTFNYQWDNFSAQGNQSERLVKGQIQRLHVEVTSNLVPEPESSLGRRLKLSGYFGSVTIKGKRRQLLALGIEEAHNDGAFGRVRSMSEVKSIDHCECCGTTSGPFKPTFYWGKRYACPSCFDHRHASPSPHRPPWQAAERKWQAMQRKLMQNEVGGMAFVLLFMGGFAAAMLMLIAGLPTATVEDWESLVFLLYLLVFIGMLFIAVIASQPKHFLFLLALFLFIFTLIPGIILFILPIISSK